MDTEKRKEAEAELELLREQLEGAENDLRNYAKNASHDPLLKANYNHKQAQVLSLEARIAELDSKTRTDG